MTNDTDTTATADPFADEGLFDMKPKASNLLRERYTEPPFSVLDRKGKAWQRRDKKWRALGIESELGRDDGLTFNMRMDFMHDQRHLRSAQESSQTSIFSPTLCELVYRWYSAPGHRVLDPFAGGSVRGVVAGAMARNYTGVELRAQQVEANRQQADIAGDVVPSWIAGDSAEVVPGLVADGYESDLVFSCPPYAYLEKYSDDPGDLSNMPYGDFLDAYRGIIRDACETLADNRFAAWVVGEVREKGGDGSCVGLVPDTIRAFQDAGLDLYNDHILLTPIGTAAVRTPRQFDASRKAGRIHEYLLVFVKGDAKKATIAANGDRPTTDLDEDVADHEAAGGDA
ncbi:hypothetical protein NYO98_10605 [Nocardioides sp. STR2]|uniref:DNA methylase n=1 Tax=Nocardioides pini TaxID=2975053 RepID=A0ABT4CF39_9ACTN|nr:hypothetical protein [Nocardioides pini]MCY4726729.1 hypothetical protein [Nocardioides pini]